MGIIQSIKKAFKGAIDGIKRLCGVKPKAVKVVKKKHVTVYKDTPNKVLKKKVRKGKGKGSWKK